jgi:hypothetical protein
MITDKDQFFTKKAGLSSIKVSSAIEKIEIMCYTDENSAFTEINALKTDFQEVVSYIADEV